MSAGKRDTLIVFEARTIATDPDYNTAEGEDWGEHSRAWAEVVDTLPSRAESLDDSISIQRRPARIRVEYYDGLGITSAMRISIPGGPALPDRTLRIIAGPALKRDTSEWEFMAEELNVEGVEP